MSDALPSTPRTNVGTLVVQRGDGALLLVDGGNGMTLPVVETRGHWYAEVGPINVALAERYGVRATALRTLRHELDERTNVSDLIIAMEAHDARRASPDTRWVTAAASLSATAPERRPIIAGWLDQAAFDRARPLRRDWSRAGWYDATMAWCRDRLSEQAIVMGGEPEQVKHWSIASIWRIATDRGDVWLKAVPPYFAHEGAVIELIAPSMPQHLPRVIAADRARGLLLLHAFPGDDLRAQPDGAANDRAVRILARLQQAWAPRIDDLMAAGAADRRTHTLDGALEAVIGREAVRARFTDDEVRRLLAFGRTVPAQVEALRACGVPETLMHGDFYPGNIAQGDGELVVFDWTDACVSHPFFDLATFLPRDSIEHAAATQAMIEAWSPSIATGALERAAELAAPLACIHHSTSYMRLLDTIDPTEHWEFSSDVLFWLHWLRAIIED